jgi:Tfp pilus assembly protein PilV
MSAPPKPRRASGSAGFTYIEVLVAGALLSVVLLGLCAVFLTGYSGVTSSGRATVGVAAARQMIEAVRLLPFASVGNLNGFDTDNAASQPASGPEREIARRWRYALAGEGVGWTFTTAEKTRWTNLLLGEGPLRGKGTVTVTPRSGTLWEITVSVNIPGRFKPVAFKTYLARMS